MRKLLAPEKVDSAIRSTVENFHIDIVNEIEMAIAQNEWVIVGMAQNPICKKARKQLDEKAIRYHYIEHGSYFSMWRERLAIKLWSGWPTFPQVFHKGMLVGGSDDLVK